MEEIFLGFIHRIHVLTRLLKPRIVLLLFAVLSQCSVSIWLSEYTPNIFRFYKYWLFTNLASSSIAY